MLSMQNEQSGQPQGSNQQRIKPQPGAQSMQEQQASGIQAAQSVPQGSFRSQQSSGAHRWGSYGAQSQPSSGGGGWGQSNRPKATPAAYTPNFGGGGTHKSDAQMKGGVGMQAQPYTAPAQPAAPQSVPDPTVFWAGGNGSPVRPSTPAPQPAPTTLPDPTGFWMGGNGSPVRQGTPPPPPPQAASVSQLDQQSTERIDAKPVQQDEAPSFFGIPRYGRSFAQY